MCTCKNQKALQRQAILKLSLQNKKNQHICDAFINGIISICISQQLFESSTSSLEDYDQARTLEKAQNQSASYDSGSVARITK